MRARFLAACARLALGRPWTVIVAAVLLAAICAAYAALRLVVNANTDDLIAPDRPYMRDYRAFQSEFGDLEAFHVVVVGLEDDARTATLVEELTAELRGIEGLAEVHCAILPDEQRALTAPAASDEDLAELARLADAFAAWSSPQGGSLVLADARRRIARLRAGGGFDVERQEALGAAALASLELFAERPSEPDELAAGIDALIAARRPEYLRSETGRLWFIEVMPQKDFGTLAVIEEPLARVRAAIAAFRSRHPDVEIGLTGKPVLQADEMRTTDADMTRSSVIAIVLVGALFSLLIGGFARPIAAVVALVIAIAWTFGAATLLVGQLNLLSIVFTLILVGIGIDFGVHIVTRYIEERARLPLEAALHNTIAATGRGNLSGALTSSIAFLMTLFTDFQGLRELGVIGGVGLLLCLIAMTLVLPAMLVVIERKSKSSPRALRPLPSLRMPFADRPLARVAVLFVTTATAAVFVPRPQFDGNVLDLQAEGLDSVLWEHRVLDDSASASWFAGVIVDDEPALARRLDEASAEPTIGSAFSVFDLISPISDTRRSHLRAIAAAGAPLPLSEPASWTAADLAAAADDVAGLAASARERAPQEVARLASLAVRLGRRARAIEDDPTARDEIEARLRSAAATAVGVRRGAAAADDAKQLREILPAALRDRLIAPSGRLLLSLHPREDIWSEAAMERFVSAVRRIDPHATGVPITHSESIRDMRGGFVRAAVLALLGVAVIVALDFRRPLEIALALLPLVVGFVWLLLLMGALGVDFNLANFFAVPILIGLGVDSGIHLVHRLASSPDGRLGSTRRAIVLTNATSIIGFGCLLLAHHRGLRSLGLVMALGCITGLVATLALLPPIFRLVRRRFARTTT